MNDPRLTPVAAPPYYVQRMWLFFAGYFLFGGVTLPFYPVWLEARGLTDFEIAQLVALPSLARVFLTPLAGIYADRAPNRRFAVITFTVPALLIFLLAWPAQGFWPLIATAGFAFTLWGLALPPAEALALTGVRRFGLDYGRMRMGGSVAFIVANLTSGLLLGWFTKESIYFFILFTMTTSVAVSFLLPVTPPQVRAMDDAARPDTRASGAVLGNAGFVALMAAAALILASHGMLYSFGSIEWTRLGFGGPQIGAFWAFSLTCEILLFTFSRRILMRLGPFAMVMIGAVGAVVRWVLFPMAAGGGFAAFALLQCLHGLSFGATYLGTQHLIARLIPERHTASAQGILAMGTGATLAIVTSVSGAIYETYGINGFYFMVPLPLIGVALLMAARSRIARP